MSLPFPNQYTFTGGPIKALTPNYGFNKINFDFPRWHTYEWTNWDLLDSTLWGLRGYSETESDARYVNVTGDTMTGKLTLPTSGIAYIQEWSHRFDGATTTAWFGSPADGAFEANKLTGLSSVYGGVSTVDGTIKVEGTHSGYFTTPAKTTSDVPKAHWAREGWLMDQMQTVRYRARYRIPSGKANYSSLMIVDFEIDGNTLDEPLLIDNFFGMRIASNSDRTFRADLEYYPTEDPLRLQYSTEVTAGTFPTDQFFLFELEMYLHSVNGWLKIWIDGVLIYHAINFRTLPTAEQINAGPYGLNVTGPVRYNMLQGGITANGSSTVAHELWCDDVWASTSSSAVNSAGINIPHGTTPTAPVNGDMWSTSSGFYVRVNGSTVGPLGATDLTDYVNVSGDTMTGSLALPLGSASEPAVTFGMPQTGIFGDVDYSLNFTAAGSITFSVLPSLGIFSNLRLVLPAGTAASPAVSVGANNIGMYRTTTNTLGFSTAGTLRFSMSTTAMISTLPLALPASTSSLASTNLPHGTAPSAPVNGDVWTTSAGMYVRVNGATVGPLGAGGGSGTPSDTLPVIDGVAAAGVLTTYSRGDHKHPTDTSREPAIAGGDATYFWAGDKTWKAIDASAGLDTAEYTFNTTTTAPPGVGTFRLNNATQSSATALYLHDLKADGTDISNGLRMIDTGDKLLLQDKTTAGNAHNYTVTGPAVDNGTYFTVPISWVSTAGSNITAGRVVVAIFGLGVTIPAAVDAYTKTESDANYVNVNGDTMLGSLILPAGSQSAPSVAFTGATNTGLFLSGSSINYSVGGANKAILSSTVYTVTVPIRVLDGAAATPQYGFYNDTNSGLYLIADNQVGMSTNGVLRWTWTTTDVTSTLPIILPAATTTTTSLRLPHGTAPTTPTNGDVWTTTGGIYTQINGATVGPLGTGGGSGVTDGDKGDIVVSGSGATWLLDASVQTANDARYVNVTGDTITGTLTVDGGITSGASIEVPFGGLEASGGTVRFGSTTGLLSNVAQRLSFITGGVYRMHLTNTELTSTIPIAIPVGSAGTPSLQVGGTTTGLFGGGSTIGFSTSGTSRMTLASTQLISTVPFVAPAATTSIPSVRMPHGAAPTTPTNGDVWTTTAGMYVQINGSTVGPLATSAGVPLTDGDKGDVVVSASGATWMFDSAVVTAAAKTVLDDASVGAMLTTMGGAPTASPVFTGVVTMPGGTIAAPGIHFGTATTGIAGSGTSVNLSVAGARKFGVSSTTAVIEVPTTFPAGTTTGAPLTLPHGSAPTTPTNGDVWTTTSGIYVQVNGSTVGPLATSSGTPLTDGDKGDIVVSGSGATWLLDASVQTANDARYVNVTGDTITGAIALNVPSGIQLSIGATGIPQISANSNGHMTFGYNLYTDYTANTYKTSFTHGSAGYNGIKFDSTGTYVATFAGATTAGATVTPTWYSVLTTNTGQPIDATLTALAGLNSTAGLVEQTGADTFTKRLIGVANTTDIPTRADADTRYAAASHSHTAANVSDFSEAVDDRVAVLIQNGTGITWSYNDASGTLTPTVTVSGGQPADATLTALAALDSTAGILEQTGADAFTKRAMGVGATTSLLTRADGDGRYEPLDSAYTKSEADARYEPIDSAYTKSEADARYEPIDSAYTKSEADTLLNAKAPLASPALTGNPTAPTPTAGDNDTTIATTAFVTAAVAAGGGGGGVPEAPTDDVIYGRGGAVSNTWEPVLPLSGGILTGYFEINTNNPWFLINKVNSGESSGFGGAKGGLARWDIMVGDNAAESTGNAGSNFLISSYNDAGSWLDDPLNINRATGVATFSQTPTVDGTALAKVATISTSAPSGGVDGDVWYVVV